MSGLTKQIFLSASRWYFHHADYSRRLRDFILWPLATRLCGNAVRDVVRLKKGFRMETHWDDIVGRMITFYGPSHEYVWEPKTEQLAELLVRDADCIMTAGAHIGYFALFLRSVMRKQHATVHAFEPIGRLFKICKRNFVLNQSYGGLVARHAALSDRVGELRMTVHALASHVENDAKEHGEMEIVPALSVDRYVHDTGIRRVDFMLLDVEGHEWNVFQGMRGLFDTGRPSDIIFEENRSQRHRGGDFDAIVRLLHGYGYRLYLIDDNYELSLLEKRVTPVRLFSLSATGHFFQKNHFNVLATRREERELADLGIMMLESIACAA